MAQTTTRPTSMPTETDTATTRLTGLIAAGLTSLGAFFALAGAVLTHAIVAFNISLLLTIHAMAGPAFDPIMLGLTTLGSAPVMLGLGLVLAGVFVARGLRFDATCLIVTMGGGAALVEGLKHIFHQARPTLFPTLVHETGYSFPSGHSTLSFCLLGYLAGWLLLRAPRAVISWLGALACVALAAAIAFSRLYLGVHWPSDVTGGALIAIAWVSLVLIARQLLLAGRGRSARA